MPMHKKDPECSLSLLLIPLEGEASEEARQQPGVVVNSR